MLRGIRGATTVPVNDAEMILEATKELLLAIQEANDLQVEDISAVFFTMTADLDRAFPARAARELGWTHVPLLDMQQAHVPGDLPRCIRIMVMAETDRPPAAIKHIYHGEAQSLRPDLTKEELS